MTTTRSASRAPPNWPLPRIPPCALRLTAGMSSTIDGHDGEQAAAALEAGAGGDRAPQPHRRQDAHRLRQPQQAGQRRRRTARRWVPPSWPPRKRTSAGRRARAFTSPTRWPRCSRSASESCRTCTPAGNPAMRLAHGEPRPGRRVRSGHLPHACRTISKSSCWLHCRPSRTPRAA